MIAGSLLARANPWMIGLLEFALTGVGVVRVSPSGRAFALRMKFADKPNISFMEMMTIAIMTESEVAGILAAAARFAREGFGIRILRD